MAAGATYEPIATTTLGSAASSITFSSIPATYSDLRLNIIPLVSTTGQDLYVQFNSDTGTNYSVTTLYGNGTSALSFAYTSNTYLRLTRGASVSSTIPTFYTLDIFSYAGSTYKTSLGTRADDQNGSGSTAALVGLWRSTSAINTITISSGVNLASGSIATLYGIKSA